MELTSCTCTDSHEPPYEGSRFVANIRNEHSEDISSLKTRFVHSGERSYKPFVDDSKRYVEKAPFDVNKSYSNLPAALDTFPSLLQSVPTVGRPQLRTRPPANRRYRKHMIIGCGADGKVFLATDLSTGEQVALKEILIAPGTNRTLKQSNEDAKKMETMKRQIDTLRRLPPHANVVQHLGAERTTCSLSITMEYVAGGSVSALLGKLGPFSERVVRLYTRNICTALTFLHKHGIIHRDIKGANCLVDLNGVAKVADFGCCLIHGLQDETAGQKGIHGTSMWMSPECIQSLPVSGKTDIWGLGCTVIEMATGKPPWHEAHFTNEWAAMFHISQSGRGPPIPPHLSRQAHRFLKRCFEVDPASRPSAEDCLEDPFLAEEFDSIDSNPEMMPPSPSELDVPYSFPFRKNNVDIEMADTSSIEFSTSEYSSMPGGVYDQEWGDAETALGEEDVGEDVDFNTLTKTKSPDVDFPRQKEVSHDAITNYIRAEVMESPRPSFLSDRDDLLRTKDFDDEFGIGLPEPVLYNVFFFLDARSLCRVSLASCALHKMVEFGAKEVLWRTLFINVFGAVDSVAMALRKSWKTYFKNSLLQSLRFSDERMKLSRQMGQSENVFEGFDRGTCEPVVFKFERCLPTQRRQLSGAPFQRLMSPVKSDVRVDERNKDTALNPFRPFPYCALKTPQKIGKAPNTPLKASALRKEMNVPTHANGMSTEEVPASPGAPKVQQQLRLGYSIQPRPIQQMVSQITPLSSPTIVTQVPTLPTPQKGRFLPRSRRLPSPSLMAISSSLPSRGNINPRDFVPPAQFIFFQPSTIKGEICVHDHATEREWNSRAKNVDGHAHSAPHDLQNGSLALPRDQLVSRTASNWHDLYDFHRSAELVPLAARPSQRSLLLHSYKFLKHLEALGTKCVPRVYSFIEGVAEDQRNVLVTSKLGHSLNELLLFCGNKMSLRTICLLTVRLLHALEQIHERDVVHGNISPTNVVMGPPEDPGGVYLINFSQSRFFRDPRTHRATMTSTSSASAQRARKQNEFLSFCSTFVQRNCTAAPRDDVIAVGYVLCYLFHGGLPWTRERILNMTELVRQKNSYLDTLQRTPPIQLHYFLKSGYALRQGDVPDYKYLKNLVSRIMEEKDWNDDAQFDWSPNLERDY
jgi:serine/threonine protein kinase